MTKHEFLTAINDMLPEGEHISCITDQEYAVIESVYNFHPSISETGGKKEIAYLYVTFGWAIIKDMEPRAKLMMEKERQLAAINSSLQELEKEMDDIKKGRYVQEVF